MHTPLLRRGKFIGDNPFKEIANRPSRHFGGDAAKASALVRNGPADRV